MASNGNLKIEPESRVCFHNSVFFFLLQVMQHINQISINSQALSIITLGGDGGVFSSLLCFAKRMN